MSIVITLGKCEGEINIDRCLSAVSLSPIKGSLEQDTFSLIGSKNRFDRDLNKDDNFLHNCTSIY